MKIRLILIGSALLLFSCLAPDEDRPFTGLALNIVNKTNKKIVNAKIKIGGIQNGEFIATELYLFPTINIRTNDTQSQNIAIDDNRWKPNLELVKSISNNAYFTVELEGKDEILLYESFDNNKLLNINIVENGIIKSNYGGRLGVSISENSITGTFHVDN